MDEILLKNSIRLLIGGYLYDASDECNKLADIPRVLRKLADDYEKEITKAFISEL
jgi:hypothetical protein